MLKNLFRKAFILQFAVLSLFSFYSCEEDFSPKSAFKSGYVLYCVIQGNEQDTQGRPVAIIAQYYDVPGIDPSVNMTAPEISGATVRLIHRGDIYTFTDTLRRRSDTTRYTGMQPYYRGPVLQILSGDSVTISARMPDGTELRAGTRVPRYLDIEYTDIPSAGFRSNLDPFRYGTQWKFSWYSREKNLCFPKIYINYRRTVDSNETSGRIEVPASVITRNGAVQPIYQQPTRGEFAAYDYSAFDWAMAKISEGVADKSLFRITGIHFEVVEYDQALSDYYSSTNGYLDNFSLRLDEQIYTNVSGGGGIFGTYFVNPLDFRVDGEYITSFGYRK